MSGGWPKGKARSPETRAKMAAAARNRDAYTAGMTDAQMEAYRLFRRKGYAKLEAARLARGDK